jgi:hypothetical protein
MMHENAFKGPNITAPSRFSNINKRCSIYDLLEKSWPLQVIVPEFGPNEENRKKRSPIRIAGVGAETRSPHH